MQTVPKCFSDLSVPKILAGQKLIRSVNAAKSVADSLKAAKNMAYRYLEKVIA